ncbi:unnamed protein product [Adineta ricciae]|uniref:Uncharacterized protein n=1 Tax=Adineta ricciae TaxID=249248 RepID=A0A815WDS1_ADIRI|nr:unnamed protein product [Adineta ricciae]CAF1665537.1 unnamed protein product [Adineta ricciae]
MNDEIADAVQQICDAVCTVVDEDKTTDDRGAINEQRDDHHADNRNNTPVSQIVTLTTNQPTLINISDINTDITYPWKIHAIVTCIYPKRSFTNSHGAGEISNWDLTDQSSSITLVAFNLNSYMMSEKLVKNQVYEFLNLTIKSADEMYKTLPHPYQLVCTNATCAIETERLFDLQESTYNFTPLSQMNTLPLNSIVGKI